MALLLAVLAVGCEDTRSEPPGTLEQLLGMVPAEVVSERALYYSDLRAVRAFASALPLAASGTVLGVEQSSLDEVLESGAPTLTLFAGDVSAAAVTAAVGRHGYSVAEREGWRVFRRGRPDPGAPPLVTAVPAGAVRDGLLVLGSVEEVDAVVAAALDGRPPPDWAPGLLRSLGPTAAVAIDARDDPFAESAARQGVDLPRLLERAGVDEPLADYRAAALSWHPRSEFDGVPAPAGTIALAVPDAVDGHEQAAALAVRAATAPLLGEGGRRTADLLEGGGPRFDDELRTVRLPVRWRDFDAAALRRDLDAGHLLFLAPGGS